MSKEKTCGDCEHLQRRSDISGTGNCDCKIPAWVLALEHTKESSSLQKICYISSTQAEFCELFRRKYPQDELFEELAEIEHKRWTDWQSYCHKVLRENCPSAALEEVLKRWDKQINTPYCELSEKEQDMDREEVLRYWHMIREKK